MTKVGIVGAGTMGQGIAQAFATAGYSVTVCDVKIEWAQGGIDKIGAGLDKLVGKGKMEADAAAKVKANLKTGEYKDLADADLVVEGKQVLEEKSHAFIVAPGGVGTFDEFFEIITLKQLGRHNKAIIILNIDGYYNELLKLMDKALKEDFLTEKTLELYFVANCREDVVNYLKTYQAQNINLKETKYI